VSRPEDDVQFRRHAGTVLWPTTPDVLTDSTKCPACFTPLTALSCRNCGLNLAHPAAHELASLSRSASAALSERVEVIGRIRYETASGATDARPTVADVAGTAPAVDSPMPASAQVVAPRPAEPSPLATQPDNADARFASPPSSELHTPVAPRRSGVQVALLIAGVSLLSIFAIYFLVYAFINYGIVWRSVIIAAITVTAFVSASLLRRKALVASAEGLAVFAVVLIYLDAYALRANDFFGLATADAATYWGATITIASLGFILWHRVAGMRAASLACWAGLALGVGFLVWGLGDGVEPFARAFIALAAAATVGLAQALVPKPLFAGTVFTGTVERMLVLSSTSVALAAAFLWSWAVEPLSDFGGTIALTVVAVIAFAHAAVAAAAPGTTPAVRVFGYAFATVGGVAAAAAASATAVRVSAADSGFATFVPAVSAAAVAVLLEVAFHRLPAERLRRSSFYAAWGAAAVLGLAVLVPLSDAASPIAFGLLHSLTDPLAETFGSGLAAVEPTSDLAVLALASVVALAAALWLLTGALHRRGAVIAWGGSVVLVLAAAQLPVLWMSLAAWLLIAAVAYVLLVKRRDLGPTYRACLASVLVVGATLMYLLGWGSLGTWAATTLATIVVLLAARRLVRTSASRATLLGAAVLAFLIGVVAAAHHLVLPATPPTTIAVLNAASLSAIVAPLLLALSAIGYKRVVTSIDRRTIFWISGLASAAAALVTLNIVTELASYDQPVLLLPQPVSSLVASILILGTLLLWVGLSVNAGLRLERGAASIALGPAILWVVDSFARMLDLPSFAQSVVPVTAALLAAAGSITLILLRPHGTPRWAREAGIALVGVPAVAMAVATEAESGWLVLLIGAVAVLLIAVSPDGLFASSSSRRHLGWVALALATAGLWWRLSSGRVEALEPYVLPLAGALLAIAALIHRAAMKAGTPGGNKAAPVVALSGLMIAILPLAANSLTGDPIRAYTLFGVSAVLLVAGSHVIRPRARPYLDAIAAAGLAGVLVTAGGRALLAPVRDLVPDAWLAAVLAVLVVAAVGQIRQRNDSTDRRREILSQVLVGTGIVLLSGIEAQGFSDAGLGAVRAIATVALLSALHVIAFVVHSPPFTRAISYLAVVFAAAAAGMGAVTGALDPIELGTAPIAIALLATGGIRLSTEPELRSWRALAPGLVVLLVPSLLVTIGEPELWRLVGLGVVSVTVLIVGAVRRLQAPFILGLGISLIHGFATFAPQIRAVYESQEWWLWAGLAGIVLVLLAIRYEKRIQDLRNAVGRIAALR
jgi:hypothetical protein